MSSTREYISTPHAAGTSVASGLAGSEDVYVPIALTCTVWLVLHIAPVWLSAMAVPAIILKVLSKYKHIFNVFLSTRAPCTFITTLILVAAAEVVTDVWPVLGADYATLSLAYCVLHLSAASLMVVCGPIGFDPGFVPLGQPHPQGLHTQDLAACKGRVCYTCQGWRPSRSKHCNMTRRCVQRYDHYSPLVGNVIGQDNQLAYFVLLNALLGAAILYVYLATAAVLWDSPGGCFPSIYVPEWKVPPPPPHFPPPTNTLGDLSQGLQGQLGRFRWSGWGEAEQSGNFRWMGCASGMLSLHPAAIPILAAHLLVIPALAFLAARSWLGVLANMTVNEMMNWDRYVYMVDEGGYFSNLYDRGPVINIFYFVRGGLPLLGSPDWDEVAAYLFPTGAASPLLSVSRVLNTASRLGLGLRASRPQQPHVRPSAWEPRSSNFRPDV